MIYQNVLTKGMTYKPPHSGQSEIKKKMMTMGSVYIYGQNGEYMSGQNKEQMSGQNEEQINRQNEKMINGQTER